MNRHKRLLTLGWMIPIGLVVAVVGAHVILFYFVRHLGARTVVSGTVFTAVFLLIIGKHLGLFAAILRAATSRMGRKHETREHRPD